MEGGEVGAETTHRSWPRRLNLGSGEEKVPSKSRATLYLSYPAEDYKCKKDKAEAGNRLEQ